MDKAAPAIAVATGSAAGLATTYGVTLAGFGAAGVKAYSLAAMIQSTIYGAAVPAGSLFAGFQSMGATGAALTVLSVPAGIPISVAAGMGAWWAVSKVL